MEEKRIKPEGINGIIGVRSVSPYDYVKTCNDEIIIPGESVVRIEINL